MSEHKTTTEIIAEIDYEIGRLENIRNSHQKEALKCGYKMKQLEERKQSLINYQNTDSDSINQDKTE